MRNSFLNSANLFRQIGLLQEANAATAGLPIASHVPQVLQLLLTFDCGRACGFCVDHSGPRGDALHALRERISIGEFMSFADWKRVLREGFEAGFTAVSISGGDPMKKPYWLELSRYAILLGYRYVEVFATCDELIPVETLQSMAKLNIVLATSYYSYDPRAHRAITNRNDWRILTRNIMSAVKYGVPLRIGLGEHEHNQGHFELTRAYLAAIRVHPTCIAHDHNRKVGRAAGVHGSQDSERCNSCTDGTLTIGPDGMCHLCMFGTDLDRFASVKRDSVTAIMSGVLMRNVQRRVFEATVAVRAINAVLDHMNVRRERQVVAPTHQPVLREARGAVILQAGDEIPLYSLAELQIIARRVNNYLQLYASGFVCQDDEPECDPSCPPCAPFDAGKNARVTKFGKSMMLSELIEPIHFMA